METNPLGCTISTCSSCSSGSLHTVQRNAVNYFRCSPTPAPTKPPTKAPTKAPTKHPTKPPTRTPTTVPTKSPTTSSPTVSEPTAAPRTSTPSVSPTTQSPTISPTVTPTSSPVTTGPSWSPTTAYPTMTPTTSPTVSTPTVAPTTSTPSVTPTTSPPTRPPSHYPSAIPTITTSPTLSPTTTPTRNPTTNSPTPHPTTTPTDDRCRATTCARDCLDGCGWDEDNATCIAGATTTNFDVLQGVGCVNTTSITPDETSSVNPSSTPVWIYAVVVVVVLVIIVVAVVFAKRRYKTKSRQLQHVTNSTLAFENPVYDKSLSVAPSNFVSSSTQYEGGVYEGVVGDETHTQTPMLQQRYEVPVPLIEQFGKLDDEGHVIDNSNNNSNTDELYNTPQFMSTSPHAHANADETYEVIFDNKKETKKEKKTKKTKKTNDTTTNTQAALTQDEFAGFPETTPKPQHKMSKPNKTSTTNKKSTTTTTLPCSYNNAGRTCRNTRIQSHLFCKRHACEQQGCDNSKATADSFCVTHTPTQDDHKALSSVGDDYHYEAFNSAGDDYYAANDDGDDGGVYETPTADNTSAYEGLTLNHRAYQQVEAQTRLATGTAWENDTDHTPTLNAQIDTVASDYYV